VKSVRKFSTSLTVFLLSNLLFTLASFSIAKTAQAAPKLKLASDTDNISTVQDLSIGRQNISFDAEAGATGQASVTWRATITDNPSGASFTIMRTGINDSSKIADDIRVVVEDGAGDLAFVPNSKFVAGAPLSSVGTIPDNLGTVTGNGECRFKLKLLLNSRSASGAGTTNTGLIITGNLNQ
jgi:hypothetical protein